MRPLKQTGEAPAAAVAAASSVNGTEEDVNGRCKQEARTHDDADESNELTMAVTRRDREEQKLAEAAAEEDPAWAADVASRRDAAIDEDYLEGGCAFAHQLMRHPSAECLQRCHGRGGVIVGVGRGCGLLGHTGRRKYAIPYEDEGVAVRLSEAELREIREEALADDIEIVYAKMCAWSPAQARAYFENNGVMPAKWRGGPAGTSAKSHVAEECGATRLLLPYVIGCTPAACCPLDTDGWRGLRAATVRADVGDCKHGFSAIGLPAGCVLSVLTNRRHALRSILGSSAPKKLVRRVLDEAHGLRAVRLARKKADGTRLAALADMHEEMRQMQGDTDEQYAVIDTAARNGGSRTRVGEFRGGCTACGACSGYARPLNLLMNSRHWYACACCGCPSTQHERR